MGLAKRVIPTLLVSGRQLVKGKRFNAWRSVGLAVQAVRIHQARGVDELCLLDISATPEGRGPDLALIEELAQILFCPLTVGGGVRSVEDVRALLRAGADKVAIRTAACHDPDLIARCADKFGTQAIVASIDALYVSGAPLAMGCFTERAAAARHVILWARETAQLGAGEILLTTMEREGEMVGYDLDLIKRVTESVDIPVIAHGGCGEYEHMRQAIEAGASAVAAGAMFQFTDATPRGAAEYLANAGMEVRL